MDKWTSELNYYKMDKWTSELNYYKMIRTMD